MESLLIRSVRLITEGDGMEDGWSSFSFFLFFCVPALRKRAKSIHRCCLSLSLSLSLMCCSEAGKHVAHRRTHAPLCAGAAAVRARVCVCVCVCVTLDVFGVLCVCVCVCCALNNLTLLRIGRRPSPVIKGVHVVCHPFWSEQQQQQEEARWFTRRPLPMKYESGYETFMIQ